MNTEKLEKLKKSLDNKFIPDNMKDKIRAEIKKLEADIKTDETITATEVKEEVKEIEKKVEKALEVAEEKEEQAEAKAEEKKEKAPRKAREKKATQSETKTPKVEPKSTAKKKSVFSIAKEIRKDNESWEDAKERARKMMKSETTETKKKTRTETDKLLAMVRRNKEYKKLAGTSNLPKDASRRALPRGKRVSDDGNVYYENRANRVDVGGFKNAYLENGGGVDGIIELKPLELIPLSTQLNRLSGYNWTSGDWESEDGGKPSTMPNSAIVNVHTKQKFRLSPFYVYKGIDHYNSKPLYRVEDMSEEGEYVGEWYTNREEAVQELKEMFGSYADKGVYVETLDEEIDLTDDGIVKATKTQQGGNKSFGERREMHGASPEALAFDNGGSIEDEKFKKFINSQVSYIISLKTISQKREPIQNLLDNMEDYRSGSEIVKRITTDNLKYALQQKTASKMNEVLRISLNALQYADGGTIIGTPETPLARGLDIDYTGLIGETGGMSAGEMFAEGGSIENQYEGKTPSQIWSMLSVSQKYHFLEDHSKEIESTPMSIEKATKTAYKFLPTKIKKSFEHHVEMGQYAYGGDLDKYKLELYDMDYAFISSPKLLELKKEYANEIKNKGYKVFDLPASHPDYKRGNKWGLFKPKSFAKGGYTNERRHVNKAQDYEVRYAKQRPNRTGYSGKRSFEEGGFMTDPNFGDFQNQVYAEKGAKLDNQFSYMMLSRLQMDCDYYLGYGNRNKKVLWAGNVDDHIAEMKKLWNSLPKNEKPEWLTMEDILDYEKKMKSDNYATGGGVDGVKRFDVDFYKSISDKGTSEEKILRSDSFEDIIENAIKIAKKENYSYIEIYHKGFFIGSMKDKDDYDFKKGRNYENNPLKYATGGVTKNYINRNQLNTITIKKSNQKLTYKVSDVYNGAYKLEDGGNLKRTAFYVSKRNVVKVQLKDGKDVKVANGYWIKKGAKPIHTSKYDNGGEIRHEDYDDVIDMWDKLSISQRKKLLDSQEDLEEYGNHSEIAEDDWDELDDYVTDVLENNFKSKMYAGGGYLKNGYFKNEIDNDYIEEINKYYNKWNSVKDEKDSENFKKIKPPMFGTYKTTDILEQIKHFEKLDIPFQANEVSRNQFKKEVSKIIDNFMNKKSYDKGGSTKRGGAMQLAKQIRKDGESWQSALKRANEQMRNK